MGFLKRKLHIKSRTRMVFHRNDDDDSSSSSTTFTSSSSLELTPENNINKTITTVPLPENKLAQKLFQEEVHRRRRSVVRLLTVGQGDEEHTTSNVEFLMEQIKAEHAGVTVDKETIQGYEGCGLWYIFKFQYKNRVYELYDLGDYSNTTTLKKRLGLSGDWLDFMDAIMFLTSLKVDCNENHCHQEPANNGSLKRSRDLMRSLVKHHALVGMPILISLNRGKYDSKLLRHYVSREFPMSAFNDERACYFYLPNNKSAQSGILDFLNACAGAIFLMINLCASGFFGDVKSQTDFGSYFICDSVESRKETSTRKTKPTSQKSKWSKNILSQSSPRRWTRQLFQ